MSTRNFICCLLLCLLFASAKPAGAAIANVQQKGAGATVSGGTFTASLTANCTPGNLVILLWSGSPATASATAITNLGNAVWTKVLAELGGNDDTEMWATTCGSTAASSVTVSIAAGSMFYNMSEWSGVTATQDSGSPTGSNTNYIPPNLTTTNANDLLISVVGTSAGAPTVPGAPWIALTTASSFHPSIYQIVSATGTYSASFSAGSGSNLSSVFAAFQASATPPSQPAVGQCWSGVAIGAAITLPATGSITISSGNSLIAFYAGNGSDPNDVSDSLSDIWVAPTCTGSGGTTVTSASGGAQNFRYVLTPDCGTFPCSATVTKASLGAGVNNFLEVCTVSGLGSVPDCGGKGNTAGTTAQTGTTTPDTTSELVLGSYLSIGTSPTWNGASTNYSTATGAPTDISGGTSSNSALQTGLVSEAGSSGVSTGLQRSFSSASSGTGGSNGARGLAW